MQGLRVPARGRGGIQVLAKPVLPRAPRATQGTTELVLFLYGGQEPYTFVTS